MLKGDLVAAKQVSNFQWLVLPDSSKSGNMPNVFLLQHRYVTLLWLSTLQLNFSIPFKSHISLGFHIHITIQFFLLILSIVSIDQKAKLLVFLKWKRPMVGKGKNLGSNAKRRSHSSKAGLKFPMAHIAQFLKVGKYAKRVSARAPVFLVAVLEYLAVEVNFSSSFYLSLSLSLSLFYMSNF